MKWPNLLQKLSARQKGYRAMFGEAGILNREELIDLARFCRAFESAAMPGDDHLTWAYIGRREVWLRIQEHLNLEPDELAALYRAVIVKPVGETQ